MWFSLFVVSVLLLDPSDACCCTWQRNCGCNFFGCNCSRKLTKTMMDWFTQQSLMPPWFNLNIARMSNSAHCSVKFVKTHELRYLGNDTSNHLWMSKLLKLLAFGGQTLVGTELSQPHAWQLKTVPCQILQSWNSFCFFANICWSTCIDARKWGLRLKENEESKENLRKL